MHVAARHRDVENIKILIDSGANVSEKNVCLFQKFHEYLSVIYLFILFYFKIIYPGYKFSLNTVLQLALQKLLTNLKSYIL